MKSEQIKKIAVAGMLTAFAFLITFVFRFKVGFLTFDFKDAIISIISLLYGPLYGIASAAIVSLLELSVSDTGVYGLIMNFISSGTFALAIGTVYKYKRSFSGAIIASVTAVFSVTAVMMLANMLVTPYYMGVTVGEVIAMIPATLLPFNLTKTIINSTTLLVIYKPFTMALRKARLVKATGENKYKFGLKSIVLMAASVVIFALAVLYLLFVMQGEFNLFK